MNRRGNILLAVTLALVLAGMSTIAQPSGPGTPALPPLKSPVDTFRELLSLSGGERAAALADRSAATRERLLEKLREYQALDADERELRLRATELRWWLLPLMRQPPTNRVAALNSIPAHLHPLIEERLQLWELLPPPLQREMLDNEEIAQLFSRVQDRTPQQREELLRNLSPARRQQLEAGLERWTALSPGERRQTCERFDRYFTLSPRERERVLTTLSDTERRQMEEALRSFEQLPREQRIVCVQSFQKFASLSVAERQEFLKNAERWEKMSPAERQAWRNLVSRVPEFPPLPPGIRTTPPPLPPALPHAPVPPITNGGG